MSRGGFLGLSEIQVMIALQSPHRTPILRVTRDLVSFLFNWSCSNGVSILTKQPFWGIIYLPKVRKSLSSHVNVIFIYGMKSMSYTIFASFFPWAKWDVYLTASWSYWKEQLINHQMGLEEMWWPPPALDGTVFFHELVSTLTRPSPSSFLT